MASTENYTASKAFVLNSIKLSSSTGQEIELYTIFNQLDIFEDVYSSTISGVFTVTDTSDILRTNQIMGFEFVTIKFHKPGDENTEFSRIFRVYKIGEVAVDFGGQKTQSYEIKFCSEDYFMSSGIKISKSYKGKTIDFIARDILEKYLFTSKLKSENIEKTSGIVDIVIPFWTPIKTIEWLATRTKKPYNFKSISKMIESEPKRNYIFAPQNVDISKDPTKEGSEREKNVIKYEFMNYFDSLTALRNGMFASSLKTFNPINLKTEELIFDYSENFGKEKHLDKNAGQFQNNYEDRTKRKITDCFGAVRAFYPTTLNLISDPVISKQQRNIRENFVENWMLQRLAKIEELNYFKLKMLVPGDNVVSIGDTITFDMPFIGVKDKSGDDSHPYFKGKYLITAIRHNIVPQKYEMLLECTKDCVASPFQDAIKNSPDFDKLKRA
jgi:hypothetical protein